MPATTGGRPTSGTKKQTYRRPKRRVVRAPSPPPYDPGKRRAAEGKKLPSRGKPTPKYRAPAPQRQPGPISERERKTKIESKRGRRAVRRGRKAIRAERQQRKAARILRRMEFGRGQKLKTDTDTHIGPFNVEAELEGRGGLAAGAEFLKKQVEKSTATGYTSAGFQGGELGENLAKDIIDLPAQAIPSGYALVAGAKEAAQGRPQRIKKLGKEFVEHDPVALVAQGKFKKAAKEAEKHPGLAALTVAGTGAIASRGAGAAARGSGEALRKAPTKGARRTGKQLRRIGSTKRAPRVAPGTGIREPRRYSRGLAGKGAQRIVEVVQEARARKMRQRARRTRDPARKAEMLAEAQRRDPRVLDEREVARRTNEREDLAEITRREAVGRVAHEARQVLPKDSRRRRVVKRAKRPIATPTDHRAAVALLVAQKVVKPTRESLKAYRAQLSREAKGLEGAELRANRRLRGQLTAALADKKLDFDDLIRHGEEYAAMVVPRQEALVERGMLAPERERKAKLVPYAVQEMGAKWNPKTKELTRNGKPLTTGGIRAHMRRNGIDPDAVPYVTQAPNQAGARNFYSSWAEPKNVGAKTRTGEATRKGTFAATRETGVENVTRMEGLIRGADSYTEWIGENAYRGRGGKGKVAEHSFDSRDAALKWRDDNLADSPYEWTAVPTRPLFGRSEQSRSLLERADAEDAASTQRGVQDAIVDALKNGNGEGKFVLVPKVAAETQANHARFLGSKGLKIARKVGRQFSGTVLTTSGFTWPLGNLGEGLLRLAVIRAGPASNRLTRMTIEELRKIDPDAARDFENRIGTGHLGSYEMQRVHTVAKEFNGTTFEPIAKAAGAIARTPGPKQIGRGWNAYTRFVFGKNGSMEHQLRLSATGRHLKREGHQPNWLRDGPKAMQKAAEQAAKGMLGTNEQVVAARFVDRAMGRYSRWSPEMRFTIAVFTPFVAWFLNAIKFFTDVLPRDHPVLVGLLASSERATEEWRAGFGLGMFVDGAAPLWMQPSVPSGSGDDRRLTPLGRYTPAGAFADPLETGAGQVLPAASGILLAAKGLDWRGEPLNDHDRADDVTQAERAAAMAKAAMGSLVPFFGLQERVRDKGLTALNPVRAYEHSPEMTKAFDEVERLEAEKKKIADAWAKKGRVVDAAHPTPEYARLHRRWRRQQETIHRESKGKYGHKFKEPYEPSGGSSSTGGGGWDRFREGSAPKQKSGWDAFRD